MNELKQSIDKLTKIIVCAVSILITFLGGLVIIILPDDNCRFILLWLNLMLVILIVVYRKIK